MTVQLSLIQKKEREREKRVLSLDSLGIFMLLETALLHRCGSLAVECPRILLFDWRELTILHIKSTRIMSFYSSIFMYECINIWSISAQSSAADMVGPQKCPRSEVYD